MGMALAYGDSSVVTLMAGSCTGLAVSFALFTMSIERHYIKTFFDTTTSSQYNIDLYLNAATDEMRIQIFTFDETKL